MKPYSEDLRDRIVKAVEGGMSESAAARLFGVSLSSVKRYARIADRGASLAPRKGGGGRPPKAHETARKLLEEGLKERPAATIPGRRCFLQSAAGKSLRGCASRRSDRR
jgi:transposase